MPYLRLIDSIITIFEGMVISILGCGWYGKALAGALVKDGETVKGSVTSDEKLDQLAAIGIQPYIVSFQPDNASFDPAFFDCDVLVISIPPKFKSGQTADYLPKLILIIKQITKYSIRNIIYISSTGVYGDINSEVNELTEPLPDSVQGLTLHKAEQLLNNNPSFKTTTIRFGGLVGPGRHPGRFFAGKRDIPNGRAPVNLIHLDDCVAITIAVIKNNIYGQLFNACIPDHPAKADFYRFAAAQAGLPLPVFIDELLNWKIVKSTNLESILNYRFKITKWLNFGFSSL